MEQTTERPATKSERNADADLAGDVMGFGLFRMSAGDVAALRKRPGPVPQDWTRVPPSLLRYSDEQSIASTAAVFTAIEAMKASPAHFEDWGIVAASRYLGRASLATALRSFMKEGVWGTSPHLIPHFALHSPSGTISLAIGSHGPNLGVGGGFHGAAEGFLTALTWLAANVVPGVWLIFSGWTPELVPDPAGGAPCAGECLALALALVRPDSHSPRRASSFRAVYSEEMRRVEAPLDVSDLEKRLRARTGSPSRLIATDQQGVLQIELVGGSDG